MVGSLCLGVLHCCCVVHCVLFVFDRAVLEMTDRGTVDCIDCIVVKLDCCRPWISWAQNIYWPRQIHASKNNFQTHSTR